MASRANHAPTQCLQFVQETDTFLQQVYYRICAAVRNVFSYHRLPVLCHHTHTHKNIAKAFKSVGTETRCWNPHVSGGHISCHLAWPPRTGYTVRSSRGTTKWCVFSHYSLLEIEGFAPGSWNTSLDCADVTRKGYPKRSSIMNPTSANEILKMHKLQFFGRFMV